MKHKMIAVAAALALSSFTFCSMADTVHEVQRGETIFGIAYKYKVSVDDLQQWNPGARNGVKKGMKIIIKDGKDAEKDAEKVTEKAVTESKPEQTKTEVGNSKSRRKRGWAKEVDQNAETSVITLEPETVVEAVDTSAVVDGAMDESMIVPESEGNNILVLLPFNAESESPTRQAQYHADFYRGLLIAAKNLAQQDGRKVEVIALDTNNDLDRLQSQLENTSNRNVAVIIAPDDENQYSKIVEYASPRGIYVINPFNFKDQEQYASNPYVIRANISQADMFGKAINALLMDYAGFTPVILNPVGAKAEKEPFVHALKARCDSLGIAYETLNFEGTLDDAALASLDPGKDYVFIPKSGSISVFNKFAPAIARLKAKDEGEGRVAMFGYPDWTSFRGDGLVLLHELQATIYSRFFYNESDPLTTALQDQFVEWYGAPMLEVLPNQGVLGYDTGAFLIGSMQEAPLGRSLSDSEYKGVQSSFSFGNVQEGESPLNRALYIITFMPDNTTTVEVI